MLVPPEVLVIACKSATKLATSVAVSRWVNGITSVAEPAKRIVLIADTVGCIDDGLNDGGFLECLCVAANLLVKLDIVDTTRAVDHQGQFEIDWNSPSQYLPAPKQQAP